MAKINAKETEKRRDELQKFKGFLPFQFDAYINLVGRKEFLEKEGLWESVHNQELSVMQGIRDMKPNEDVYLDRLLRKWVRDNPQFKDLVIFD